MEYWTTSALHEVEVSVTRAPVRRLRGLQEVLLYDGEARSKDNAVMKDTALQSTNTLTSLLRDRAGISNKMDADSEVQGLPRGTKLQ
jgi:hypothetical protein